MACQSGLPCITHKTLRMFMLRHNSVILVLTMHIPHSHVVSFPRQSQLVHLNNYHAGFSPVYLVCDLNFQV